MCDMMFGIGDRVISTINYPDGNRKIHIGSTGEVCGSDAGHVGVRWDDDVDGHDCAGRCKERHGWWVHPDSIELLDSSNKPFEFDEDEFDKLLFGD